jgi:quercetin dioxygenase-like cupin family protein
MQITRNELETTRGPAEWFTGTVFLDGVAAPSEGSRVSASCVHFTPGARTAWHTHPNGQTIWVTEGVACASAGTVLSR